MRKNRNFECCFHSRYVLHTLALNLGIARITNDFYIYKLAYYRPRAGTKGNLATFIFQLLKLVTSSYKMRLERTATGSLSYCFTDFGGVVLVLRVVSVALLCFPWGAYWRRLLLLLPFSEQADLPSASRLVRVSG